MPAEWRGPNWRGKNSWPAESWRKLPAKRLGISYQCLKFESKRKARKAWVTQTADISKKVHIMSDIKCTLHTVIPSEAKMEAGDVSCRMAVRAACGMAPEIKQIVELIHYVHNNEIKFATCENITNTQGSINGCRELRKRIEVGLDCIGVQYHVGVLQLKLNMVTKRRVEYRVEYICDKA